MYISFNDFVNNGALSLVYSDDGVTWSSEVVLNSAFIRDVQVTGTPAGTTRFEGKNSTVFVAAMDEGGGGNATRQNLMYKSLDGGKTWTSTTLGPRFNPVGDQGCASNGYFWQVNPIWRHMGWGEPAVGPSGVVHYDYSGAGTKGDDGDIFYVRSTDNGKTWSKPIKLNTDKDAPHKTQWMPSLSSDLNGNVTAAWYDRRKAKGACNNVTDPGCKYERVGRQSKDNGKTWGSDITISTAVIPQPAQDDPNIVSCYAGDYDYNTALNGNAFVTWTDGRRKVGGANVQDVDFAKVPLP
jgi:Neuraminidase (sialidase)